MEMSRRLTRIKEQVLVGSSLKASVFEQLLSKRLLVLKELKLMACLIGNRRRW